MTKLLSAVLASLLFLGTVVAQEGDEPDKAPTQSPPAAKAPPPPPGMAASSNQADGIELPKDMKVNNDEGFLPISAVCKGPVKFIVIASQGVKVKFMTNEATNTIIVSVPPQGGVISVYAIGLVEGKLTDPVRTNILVAGPTPDPEPGPGPAPGPPPGPAPGPAPGPPPGPAPIAGPLHLTFVLDLNKATPALAQVLNSPTLRKTVTDNGNFFRIYDRTDPQVARSGMDKVLQSVGGDNVLVIQRADGSMAAQPSPIPASEAEIIGKLRQAGGLK